MQTKKKIAIVGGGAAGFFCAANLDEKKFDVCIYEQASDVLQKVSISGGGRCNVTHACFDPKDLVQFYPRGHKELRSVFTKFQPGDTMDWFESRNVPLKIENDNRVFPVSNSSSSIINTLIQETERKGFQIKTKTLVKEIKSVENGFIISTSTEEIAVDFVIYTTGSSPKSLKIIENLGHQIVPPVPSLFTFNIKDPLLNDMMGTSFEQVEIKIDSLKTHESGPLLITHWGLSGPAILKISAWEARKLAELHYRFSIKVNFIGTESSEALEEFMNYKAEHPKKNIGSSKIFPLTNRFWNKILEVAKINPEKQWAQISKTESEHLINLICSKNFEVHGKSTFKDEFVTAGGVLLKEINFKNMSSKLHPNLFLAGEVLDIDAVTGGFNFQACWSEAWIISNHLNETH